MIAASNLGLAAYAMYSIIHSQFRFLEKNDSCDQANVAQDRLATAVRIKTPDKRLVISPPVAEFFRNSHKLIASRSVIMDIGVDKR